MKAATRGQCVCAQNGVIDPPRDPSYDPTHNPHDHPHHDVSAAR